MRLDLADAVAVDRRRRRRCDAPPARPSNSRPACTVSCRWRWQRRPREARSDVARRCRRPRRPAGSGRPPDTRMRRESPVQVGDLAGRSTRDATARSACRRGPPARSSGSRRRSPPSAAVGRPHRAEVLAHADRLVRHRIEPAIGRNGLAAASRRVDRHPQHLVRALAEARRYGRSADITTARPSGDQLGRPGSKMRSCAWRSSRDATSTTRSSDSVSRNASREPPATTPRSCRRPPCADRRRCVKSRTHRPTAPSRSDEYAIASPSGDQTGLVSTHTSLVSRCGRLALAGRHQPQVTEGRERDGAPSGEIVGCISPRTGRGPCRRSGGPWA